jgi:hypothetical protein
LLFQVCLINKVLITKLYCKLFSGGFNVVKFGDAIDVKGIISLVTTRLAAGTRHYRNLYAMRLHHPGSGESYWLHQDTTMYQVNSNILFFNLFSS